MTEATYQTLLVETPSAGVLLVRLNRPEALNALNSTLLGELGQALDAAAADDGVKVVVLTGSARAFAAEGVTPQVAMTARDANLIKTYVRAGLGAGLLAEMAISAREEADPGSGPGQGLCVLEAPAALPECITWAVIPRGRVLRDYALALLHALAPQLDPRDLRRVLEGNQPPDWPVPPRWVRTG